VTVAATSISKQFHHGLLGLAVAVLVFCRVGHAQTSGPAEQAGPPAPAAQQVPAPPQPEASSKRSKRTPTFFGYMQAHFKYSRKTGEDPLVDASDFRMQRVRLGVKGDVFPWLSYDVEVDPRAPEITGVLRDAFLSFRFIPNHQLRVGQQKTQFGYENRESSSDLFAVNRTELSDSLSRGVNLRDIGVGLIGHVKLGGGFRIEDAITLVNGAGLNVQDDNTRRKNVWGRVGLRYKNQAGDLVVSLGVSGATGDGIAEGPNTPADDFREAFTRQGGDLEVDHRFVFLSAEYVRGTDENTLTGETADTSGYYVNLVGKTRWRIGPILRLDTVGDEFRRWTFGTYYGLPKAPFRVMLNYEFRELRDGARVDDKLYVWTQVRF